MRNVASRVRRPPSSRMTASARFPTSTAVSTSIRTDCSCGSSVAKRPTARNTSSDGTPIFCDAADSAIATKQSSPAIRKVWFIASMARFDHDPGGCPGNGRSAKQLSSLQCLSDRRGRAARATTTGRYVTTARHPRTTATKGSSRGTISSTEYPRHGARGEQVDAERRRDHSEREVDHHDEAEVHRIDAEMQCDRAGRASTMIDADVSMNGAHLRPGGGAVSGRARSVSSRLRASADPRHEPVAQRRVQNELSRRMGRTPSAVPGVGCAKPSAASRKCCAASASSPTASARRASATSVAGDFSICRLSAR